LLSFLQIGFLTALTALAIPIVIHLAFRQRPRRAELGTLRFLRIVLAQNARWRRVMRWLLLALRLACVALIAFLFARPYWLATSSTEKKLTTAVLIDQSATMELPQDGVRLIDRAVADTKELLKRAGQRDRFEVAFFDHAVQPLTMASQENGKEEKGSLSANNLHQQLIAPTTCTGGTDYGGALEWARDVLAKSPSEGRRLVIFTDLQRSGLAWSEVDTLPSNVTTEVHDLGRSAVNNLAVVEARPEKNWLRPQEETTVHVTAYNGSPFTVDELTVVLRLTADAGKVELRERTKIEPASSQSLRLELPPLAAGFWQGTVSIESEDDLPLDNQRYVAILVSPPYQVLLVDGRSASSPVLAATYFLETSLRLASPGETSGAVWFEPKSIAAEEPLPSLDKYDVVIFADVGDVSASTIGQLRQFVMRGGSLLVFGGEDLTPANTTPLAAAGLMPGKVIEPRYASDLPFRLKTWNTEHPIFAAFSDPQLGDLARLAFSMRTELEPAKDAQVLASFRDGAPAVVERSLGQGKIVWLAMAADRSSSDWTSSRLYLPLVYQLLSYQTGLSAGGRVRQTTLEAGAHLGGNLPPGIQKCDGYTLVVNTSPREAETDRCTVEEFVGRFGLKLTDESPVSQAPVQTAALGTEMIDNEIWPWLASLLLVGLVLEGLVANRTAA
jgi:hypothetical protein